jgi:hypothetical protein
MALGSSRGLAGQVQHAVLNLIKDQLGGNRLDADAPFA